ncbi:MAG TPA: YggT family protein [Candidatus Gastranaerophilales bacterium]|nr:YggT family protein [Candidatus Gastranaerophilales bacterium]
MTLYQSVEQLFQIIWLIFLIRILLSWFPNVDWHKQPFKFVNDFTEPVFVPFRRMIPAVGGMDFSPIVVFFLLGMVQDVVLAVLKGFY